MMEGTGRIPELIIKELKAEITVAEMAELKEWIARSEQHRAFYDRSHSEEWLQTEIAEFYIFKKNVFEKISREIPELRPRVMPLFSKRIRYYYAAAVVFGVLVIAGYLWRVRSPRSQVAVRKETSVRLQNDRPPGGNKAVLTLGDGSSIVLDSVSRGTLTQQGASKIIKLDSGRLAYNLLSEKPAGMVYNKLTTPRGGQYHLVLSDGTQVWLNAASSLRYPSAFGGRDREVELTGEAYFEVAKDKSRPFKVKTANDMEVDVLGTHFDIMTYEDEPVLKTTLLEGAVRVIKGAARKTIRPGQQVQSDTKGDLQVLDNVDLEEAVAWKNGYFQFHIADIETVMRQLSRWYDVDVYYEGKKPDGHFVGEISRNNNISDVLKMLEVNGVHFRVEGRKLIVL